MPTNDLNDLNDLTCRELVELVTDYLEGALPPAERSRFESHLRACRVCLRYVDQLRTTVLVLGRLTEDDVPEPARDALLATFRTWKRGRASGSAR
jgi:anti-sigma factor RsiW